MTCSVYVSRGTSSGVGNRSPRTVAHSAASLSSAAGCWASRYQVQLNVRAVVSCPARNRVMASSRRGPGPALADEPVDDRVHVGEGLLQSAMRREGHPLRPLDEVAEPPVDDLQGGDVGPVVRLLVADRTRPEQGAQGDGPGQARHL